MYLELFEAVRDTDDLNVLFKSELFARLKAATASPDRRAMSDQELLTQWLVYASNLLMGA